MSGSVKRYKCSVCGHEARKHTNHFGQTYSWGSFNACPECPPWRRPTTWICLETPPPGTEIPPDWSREDLAKIQSLGEQLPAKRTRGPNPNCDGQRETCTQGEVRSLPLGADSNALLCRSCYRIEMRFRKQMNKDLGEEVYAIPHWTSLPVYQIA